MQHSPSAAQIISSLGLEPLPEEGGFFRQTWHNATGTAIYFLITPDGFSALHRLNRDEIWHFYAGDAVDHVQLDPATGSLRRVRLGADVLGGEQPQLVVPAGVWQGARLAVADVGRSDSARKGFALMGCTMSPGWDAAGFTLGARAELERAFPDGAEFIRDLTR